MNLFTWIQQRSKKRLHNHHGNHIKTLNNLNQNILKRLMNAFEFIEDEKMSFIYDDYYDTKMDKKKVQKYVLFFLDKTSTVIDLENSLVVAKAIKKTLLCIPFLLPRCIIASKATITNISEVQELLLLPNWCFMKKKLFISLIQHLSSMTNEGSDQHLNKSLIKISALFSQILASTYEPKVSLSHCKKIQDIIMISILHINQNCRNVYSKSLRRCLCDTRFHLKMDQYSNSQRVIRSYGIEVLCPTNHEISHADIIASFRVFGKIINIRSSSQRKCIIFFQQKNHVENALSNYDGPYMIRFFYFESVPHCFCCHFCVASAKQQSKDMDGIQGVENKSEPCDLNNSNGLISSSTHEFNLVNQSLIGRSNDFSCEEMSQYKCNSIENAKNVLSEAKHAVHLSRNCL